MPDWKNEVRKRLAELGIEPSREIGMVEEFAQHLEQHYEDLLSGGVDEKTAVDAVLSEIADSDVLASGLTAADRAPRQDPEPQAALPSGNPVWDFIRDLRHGLRALRRTPGVSVFAVLTLALGIGASTTAFTIVNTLLLHPLPVEDPGHLVAIYTTASAKNAGKSGGFLPSSYLNLKDYSVQNQVFSGSSGYTSPFVMTFEGSAGPQRLFGQLVTQNYFETLGLQPARGRFFLPSENSTPGSAPVAVLSFGSWQGKFGGAPDMVGRSLEINGAAFTVIGIAPKGFIGISDIFGPDVWLPSTMAAQVLPAELHNVLSDRGKPLFHAVARLKPGVTRSHAEANLRTIAATLQQAYPQDNESRTVSVQPITSELFSSTGGETGIVFGSAGLLAIVTLILLIACSNVANLLLARITARKQEISVRLAIGASRGRVVRQLLAESVLLGLLSGVAGFAIGYEGCQLLWSLRPPEVVDNLVAPRFDVTVFIFAFLVSVATAFIFGVVPAIRASKTDVIEGLREETRIAGLGTRSVTFGNSLLVGQVALSLVALIVAALFLRSIQRAYQVDPGFDTGHLAVFMMNPEQAGYDESRTKAFYRDVKDRVSTLPGIAQASWASNMPFWSRPARGFSIEGREQQRKSQTAMSVVNTVDLDYFKVIGVPVLRGRVFSETDRQDSRPVAIVNNYLAQKYWPRGDALGSRILLSGDREPRIVIGVVKTTNYTTLGEPPQACVYLPLRQNFSSGMTLYVRGASDPASIVNEVQHEVRNIAPQIEVSDIRTGSKIVNQVLFIQKIGVGLLGIFGLLALALASVGLYGIMAYSVSRRQREIGVRMAMGAEQGAVLSLILRQGMKLVGTGIGIGLVASLLIGRALSRALYGLSPADPVSLAGASIVLILV
ncbi:MAG TPA: ABC transporter permease, partial [Bryobacteraceae bacterium]|nr:ABC transporter permease [Bryobacteraceae bacterium]